MKFKSTVLTLLMVGLVAGVSSSAFAKVIISKNVLSIASASIEDQATGIPAAVLTYTNDGIGTVTVDQIGLASAGTHLAGDFNYTVWHDKDKNGIVSWGDKALYSGALPVAGNFDVPIDPDFTVPGSNGTAFIIVTLDAVSADTAVQIGASSTVGDNVSSPSGIIFENSTAASPLATNMPTITMVANTAQTLTLGTSLPAVKASRQTNRARTAPLINFKVTAGTTYGQVLNAIAFGAGTNSEIGAGTESDAIESIMVYVDKGTVGTMDAADIRLQVDSDDVMMISTPQTFTLVPGLYVPKSDSIKVIVAVSFSGANPTDDIIAVDTVESSFAASGVADILGSNVLAAGDTLTAMKATYGTADLTGEPYGRANGYLDAVKMTFKIDNNGHDWVSGSSKAINDSTLKHAINNGQLLVTGHSPSFEANYGGDAANNNLAYVKINETADNTASVLTMTYTGVIDDGDDDNMRIISADGLYGLPNIAGASNVPDKAPPAPLQVLTVDTDSNGMLDGMKILFSEDLVSATPANGFAISGYTIDAGASAINGGNAKQLDIVFDEEGYDTGNTPPYSYGNAVGTLSDGVGTDPFNKVLSFNQLAIPVTDNVAPKLWHVKTLDQDADGKFDGIQLDFSEKVKLNPLVTDITAADLTQNSVAEGFYFGPGHISAYDFSVTGNTGVGSSQLVFPVNEIGSLDTGVMPSLMYQGGVGTSPLVDDASSPIPLYEGTISFDMVVDEDSIEGFEDVWLEDGIGPRITSAAWLDDDGDGKLDSASLTFSEAMGPDVSTYESLSVTGHEVTGAEIVGTTVTIEVDETGYDTGDKPDITYDDDDIVDANGASLGVLASETVIEVDNAFPVLYEAKTADIGYGAANDSILAAWTHNGKIDGMVLKFSEPLNTTKLDKPPVEGGVDDDPALSLLVEEFTFNVGAYTVNTGAEAPVEFIDSQTAIVCINEIPGAGLYDTDQLPDLLYTAKGDSNLTDLAGLALADIVSEDLDEMDGAPPIPVSAETVDIYNWDLTRTPPRLYDDGGDGYLDGVIITFSEEIGSVDADMAEAAVTLTEEKNEINLAMSSVDIDDRRDVESSIVIDSLTVQILGKSAMGYGAWDTDQTPYIMIAAASGIADTTGNVVAAVDSVMTTDAAHPVLARALALIDTKEISLWFSEPVTNTEIEAGPIDENDVEYGSLTRGYSIVALDSVDSAATYVAMTDTVVALSAASLDWVTVVEDAIMDEVGLVVPPQEVSILDVVNPELTKAETQDFDGNGLIDHIKLTYSEAINDEKITGNPMAEDQTFARNDKLLGAITVDGFDVIGINMCGQRIVAPGDTLWGDDLADDATSYLRGTGVLTTQESVINVEDVANDNVLWLMIKATEALPDSVGNTDAMPSMTVTGGPMGTQIGDFRPNYVGNITDMTVADGAGPAIVKAAMPTRDILYVWMSELVALPLPAAKNVFTWKVGTEELDYVALNYVVNWNRVTDSIATYELVLAGIQVPYNLGSTLNFIEAGVVEDAEETGNIVRMEDADVYPPQFPMAVEDDASVPGEFALSKNFPNPFNPSTTINYDIAGNGGHVSLVIYNMTGQKVKTLVDEIKVPGFYSVIWNGTDDAGSMVSSGIYLYKIDCGDFSRIEKMTFVK